MVHVVAAGNDAGNDGDDVLTPILLQQITHLQSYCNNHYNNVNTMLISPSPQEERRSNDTPKKVYKTIFAPQSANGV